ncbi:MAG TPA: response regulator transcription factor [Solirubrobacteraceae bacterium]|jgi:DNA-binding NarL/FixJ family response regulator|nr:response regulator transcription factor [Solirubrobacteraceae bacterium]
MDPTNPTSNHDPDRSAQDVELPDGSIKPMIVDEHEATRLGLALILRRQPWVARCLLASDGHEAQALAARHHPEVALLDISNAGPLVADWTASLRGAHPGMAIVLTSRCAMTLSGSPRTLGATAFLPPRTAVSEIVTHVRAAVLALDHPHPALADPSSVELTERERQILLMISEGATNREIASRLHLGPDSIKKNASMLYRKLGVRNRIEAARYASSLFGPGRR